MLFSSLCPLLIFFLLLESSTPSSPSTNFTVTFGDPLLIWAAVDTLHHCGIIDVPDIPPRVYTDNTSMVHMIVGSTTYHQMNGVNFLSLNRSCNVTWNETGDPNPADFAGDEFLDSPVAFPNGTVYALVHTEYPGNVYHNCTIHAYPTCWTVTIGLAVSYDYGLTWQHARPPPYHLVASVPYGYNQSQLASGWGDPSNILYNPTDQYYYAAIWNRDVVGLQGPGVCMMRTNDLTDPSSWRGWGGDTYNISFVSPYTMEPGTADQHVCTVTNLPNCPLGSMVWSNYLQMYIASMDCSLQSGAQFYYATSTDLINWSTAQPLYGKHNLPANVSSNVTSMSYPVFLDPSMIGIDPNFNNITANPYLFWVSIGHSPYTDGRRVFATPTQFTITGNTDKNGKDESRSTVGEKVMKKEMDETNQGKE